MNNNQHITKSIQIKYIRISLFKLNKLISNLRNKTYLEALKIIKNWPSKSTHIVWNVLNSAVSNLVHNFSCQKNDLIIKEIYTNCGPMLKRIFARAKGRSTTRQKKMVHLTITLSNY